MIASPLLDHCPEGLPRAAYLAPDWFAREQATVWARNWVMLGRVGDLAMGRMRAVTVAGAPVLLTRDTGGKVAVFHNVCRHRGAELCRGERPMGRLITCPYHAWAYGTDGKLISTAHATPTSDFSYEKNGLLPVPHLIWNGFIFVNLSGAGAFMPDLGLEALDNWPMQNLITGYRHERLLACNWKVFWENYNECLHCPGIHPELCEMVPVYSRGIMGLEEVSHPTEAGTRLRDGAESWTPTGAPCGPVFDGLTARQRQLGANFVTIWPSCYIVAHVDYLRAVRLEPVSATQTRLVAEWYFTAETLAQPGFDPANIASFARLVLDQDGDAAEMNQRGLASPAFVAGRLMPQEYEIHRFHQWVITQIEAR